jgi:hypothetical protein
MMVISTKREETKSIKAAVNTVKKNKKALPAKAKELLSKTKKEPFLWTYNIWL